MEVEQRNPTSHGLEGFGGVDWIHLTDSGSVGFLKAETRGQFGLPGVDGWRGYS